jgi:prepilin-type N-terminal cleavage/methylation domain-containing protein
MKNQKGFTLIELLLVVAIIGILSGVAIPALIGQRERTRAVATAETAKSVIAEITHQNNFGVTGAAIITNITALQKFLPPACKNPYGGSAPCVKGSTAGANGEVGMVFKAGGAVAPDGTTKDVITVSWMTKTDGLQSTDVPLD